MTPPLFVAAASLISALVAPVVSISEVPMNPLSSDVPDAFLSALISDCSPQGLDCQPADLVACWMHESGLAARKQNAGALAAGFFQAMPATLRGMSFKGDATYREPAGAYGGAVATLRRARKAHPASGSEVVAAQAAVRALDKALSDAFCRLSLEAQLVWAYRYYLPHRGQLVDAGACYVANFTPGLLAHAGKPSFVICALDGSASWAIGDTPESAHARSIEWYRQNASLDSDHDGAITMGDMTATATAAQRSKRYQEIASRLRVLAGEEPEESLPETQPELPAPEAAVDVTDGGADPPLFVSVPEEPAPRDPTA